MKKVLYEVIAKRDEILKIAKKHDVENVRIFGSVASGTERVRSDIDLLVDKVKKPNAEEGGYVAFGLEVGRLFKKRRVEVCTSDAIPTRLKKNILEHNISIMEDNPKFLPKVKKDYLANAEKTIYWIDNYNEFYKEHTQQDILENEMFLDAFRSMVQKPLEEMVRFVPLPLRKQFAPETNWADMKDFRNFIVHNYDVIGYEGMWKITHDKMVELEKGTRKLYKALKEREEKKKKNNL